MLSHATEDASFLSILQTSDMALPDGAGIFVAYQIRNSSAPVWIKKILVIWYCIRAIFHDAGLTEGYGERITGADITKDLLLHASNHQIPVIIFEPEVTGHAPGDMRKQDHQAKIQSKLTDKFP
jgi:UDP-N-acetyl-D-mannosaminuronic acid transferase (WecB/TagA/CpsF family)